MPRFLKELRSPSRNQQYFSVAVPGRVVGADRESVWVDGLRVDGAKVEGRIVCVHDGSKPVESGKVVHFQADDVCDWMIVEGNGVEGAYSLR